MVLGIEGEECSAARDTSIGRIPDRTLGCILGRTPDYIPGEDTVDTAGTEGNVTGEILEADSEEI